MQRVLKYPLLLRELLKLTPADHADRTSVEMALEAMTDLSSYINEVKRDTENEAVVNTIRMSIQDLQLPKNTHLIDYGRLVKDGELRVMMHSDKNRWKQRHAFVFERMIIICKSVKNNQYAYKCPLLLSEYRLDDSTDAGLLPFLSADGTASIKSIATLVKNAQKGGAANTHTWILVHHQGENVVHMQAKSADARAAWLAAIKCAQDNCAPASFERTDHTLKYHTFTEATVCAHCGRLLRGKFFQGYICQRRACERAFHKECIPLALGCGQMPTRPAHISRATSSASQPAFAHKPSFPNISHLLTPSSSLIGQRLRATGSFNPGDTQGPDVLSVNEDDLIEVVTDEPPSMDGWIRGRVVRGDGAAGGRIGRMPVALLVHRPSLSSMPKRCDTWHGRDDVIMPTPGSKGHLGAVPQSIQSQSMDDDGGGSLVASRRSSSQNALSQVLLPPVPPTITPRISGK
jgi:hypothetical protein